jgi:hypothetical protein
MEDFPGAGTPGVVAPEVPAPPPPGASPSALELMIQHAGAENNIDPAILRALFMHESGMRSDLVGKAGELGIGQFMPGTAKAFGIDPRDPAQAIPATAKFLRMNLNRFGGNMDQALAGYAWGPANVARQGMANAPPSVKEFVQTVMGGKGVLAPPGGGGGGATPPTASTPLASAVAPVAPPQPAPDTTPAPGFNPQSLLAQQSSGNALSSLFANPVQNYQQQNAKLFGIG